jgi:hypothetical protein
MNKIKVKLSVYIIKDVFFQFPLFKERGWGEVFLLNALNP